METEECHTALHTAKLCTHIMQTYIRKRTLLLPGGFGCKPFLMKFDDNESTMKSHPI